MAKDKSENQLKQKLTSSNAQYFRLEDRVVFDASLPFLVDGIDDGDGHATLDEPIGQTPASSADQADAPLDIFSLDTPSANEPSTTYEIAFVDAGLPDVAQLIAGFGPSVEVYVVSTDVNGFEFMADTLASRTDVSALHIMGHGTSGEVYLGNSVLSSQTIGMATEVLQTIGASLTTDGDILLYGCDIAADPTSQDFIRQVAQLTAADIAASDDATGAKAQGGDWDLEFKVGEIETEVMDVEAWDNIMHTDSVGFKISTGSVAGTYNVEVFFGSWHSGGIAALGRAILYSMDPGGNPTNPANFNQVAYGDNYDLSGSNEYIFSRTTSVNFGYENSSHVYTKQDIINAGFTPGTNYFWADRYGNLIDTNVGAYANIYNHQSAVIANVGPGTYRLDYELPKPTDMTWVPVNGVDKVIFTITASGQLQVAGAANPVALDGIEDIATTLSHSDFSGSFSGTLGDVKITQLPTNGQILVNGVAVALNGVISAADLNTAGRVTYVANTPDWSGTDTFKWAGYDTAAQSYSDPADGGITIAPVNDAPSIASLIPASSPTFTEGTDTSGVSVFSAASLSTYETGQTISSITLTVGNISDGSDERLIIDGSEFALLNGETGRAPRYTYTVANSGSTSTITLSGLNLTTAEAQALITGIKYNNTSNDPTTTGGRSFMITQIKDSGGTANNGVDTANYTAAADPGMVSTVSLVAVNTNPTISGSSAASTYYENTDANQGYGAVPVFRNVTVTGGEARDTIRSMTLTITNTQITDNLQIEGTNLALTDLPGVTRTTTGNNATVVITVDGSGTATITLTETSAGSLTAQEASDLLNNLKFLSTSDDPSNLNRVVAVTSITDSQGGTITPSVTGTVAVVPINDPAVVNVPSTDYVTTKSTSLPFGNFGLGGLSISDADGTTATLVLSLSKDGASAQYGSITLDSNAVTTFITAGGTITGDGTDTVTISGSISDINALIQTANAPTYTALTGQDVVDDGPNVLTLSVTDSLGKVTTVTKDITVLPAPPNSQSLIAMGTEDTTLIRIPNLTSKITIAGSSVLGTSGWFTFGTTGTVDDSVEFTGTAQSATVFNTFPGHTAATIEVWATDTVGNPPQAVLLVNGVDYTLDTAAGTITFATAPATTTDILVKSTDGSITQGTLVQDPATNAVGLDLGNGQLFRTEGDVFTGASATFTNANTQLNGLTAAHLTATLVDANGNSTNLTIVSGAPANATEIQYDGTSTWTLNGALTGNDTLYINSDLTTGNVTSNSLNGSLVFIPNADFYGTDTFYYQYNDARATTAPGDGATTNFAVSIADGSIANALVQVNSVDQVLGTDYTVDLTTNSVTFTNPPAAGFPVRIVTTVESPVSQGLIYIAGVNDAPTVSMPAPFLQLREDLANQSISMGVSAFTDVANEIGTGIYEARLTVTNGTLNYTATDGDSSGSSDVVLADGAVNSGYLVLRGTAADLQATLNTLTFTPNADYFTNAVAHLGNGTTATYNIGSDVTSGAEVYVYVNKVLQTETTDYTVDASADTITFLTAPAAGDNVEFVLASAADTLSFTINDMSNTGTGGALSDTGTVKLVVTNVNDAPTVTADSLNTTFTEQGLPAFIFDNTRINLVEASDKVESFTFTMSGLTDGNYERIILDSREIILANGATGLTNSTYGVNYSITLVNNVATITVTKAGGLSASDTEKLIDEIRYLNISSNPTDPATPRRVTITELIDTGGRANSGNDTTALTIGSNMGIQGINSAPKISSITGAGNMPTMAVMHYEDTPASSIFTGTTIDTIESGQGIKALSLTVENVVDTGDEYITIDGQEFLLTSNSTSVTTANGLTVTVSTVTLYPDTVNQTITATVSVVAPNGSPLAVVDAQNLINGIKYRNASQAPHNENNRVLTLTSLKDDGGVASGGQDTSLSPSIKSSGGVISREIMAMGVNDAPFDIGALNDQTMVSGDVYLVLAAPVFNDVEGDGIVYSATGLPRGVTINPQTGVISGRPLTAGIFSVTVTATDSFGLSNSVTYTDTITSPTTPEPSSTPLPPQRGRGGPIFEPDVSNKTAQNTFTEQSNSMRRSDSRPSEIRDNTSDANRVRTNVLSNFSVSNGGLMVGRPLPDMDLQAGKVSSVLVPTDTFVSMAPGGSNTLNYSATLADGSPLPDWIEFDPNDQSFTITPPEGFEAELEVIVRAIDAGGNQASTLATISVKDGPIEEDGAWLLDSDDNPEKHAKIDWDTLNREFENASQSAKYSGILALSRQLA